MAWYNSSKLQTDDPCRNLVMVATAAGKLKLIDVEKNRVIWKEEFANQHFYNVDWSVNGFLAAGGD